MRTFESLISYLMAGTHFHAAALAADPEAALSARGLTLDDTERKLVECLRPLLTLPAGALLSRLLEEPDGAPQQWDSSPSLAAYLE